MESNFDIGLKEMDLAEKKQKKHREFCFERYSRDMRMPEGNMFSLGNPVLCILLNIYSLGNPN